MQQFKVFHVVLSLIFIGIIQACSQQETIEEVPEPAEVQSQVAEVSDARSTEEIIYSIDSTDIKFMSYIQFYTDTIDALIDQFSSGALQPTLDSTINGEHWTIHTVSDLEQILIRDTLNQEAFQEQYILIEGTLLYVQLRGQTNSNEPTSSYWSFDDYMKADTTLYSISHGHSGISEADLKSGIELWQGRKTQREKLL